MLSITLYFVAGLQAGMGFRGALGKWLEQEAPGA